MKIVCFIFSLLSTLQISLSTNNDEKNNYYNRYHASEFRKNGNNYLLQLSDENILKAKEFYIKALEIYPYDSWTYWDIAKCMILAGNSTANDWKRLTNEMNEYQKKYSNNYHSKKFYYAFALAWEQFGKFDLAWKYFEKAKSQESSRQCELKSNKIDSGEIKSLFSSDLYSLLPSTPSSSSSSSGRIYMTGISPQNIPWRLYKDINEPIDITSLILSKLSSNITLAIETYHQSRNSLKFVQQITHLQAWFQQQLPSLSTSQIHLVDYVDIGYIYLLDPQAVVINILSDPFDAMLAIYRGDYSEGGILLSHEITPSWNQKKRRSQALSCDWTRITLEYLTYLRLVSHWELLSRLPKLQPMIHLYNLSTAALTQTLTKIRPEWKFTTHHSINRNSDLALYDRLRKRYNDLNQQHYWMKYGPYNGKMKSFYLEKLIEDIKGMKIILSHEKEVNWYLAEMEIEEIPPNNEHKSPNDTQIGSKNDSIESSNTSTIPLTTNQQKLISKLVKMYQPFLTSYSTSIHEFNQQLLPFVPYDSFELLSLISLTHIGISSNYSGNITYFMTFKILNSLLMEKDLMNSPAVIFSAIQMFDSISNYLNISLILNSFVEQNPQDHIGYNLRAYYHLKYHHDLHFAEQDLDWSLFLNSQQVEVIYQKSLLLISREELMISTMLLQDLLPLICKDQEQDSPTPPSHSHSHSLYPLIELLGMNYFSNKEVTCHLVILKLESLLFQQGRYSELNSKALPISTNSFIFSKIQRLQNNFKTGQWLSLLNDFSEPIDEDITSPLSMSLIQLKCLFYYSLGYSILSLPAFVPDPVSILVGSSSLDFEIFSLKLLEIKSHLLFGNESSFLSNLKWLYKMKNNSAANELYQSHSAWYLTIAENISIAIAIEKVVTNTALNHSLELPVVSQSLQENQRVLEYLTTSHRPNFEQAFLSLHSQQKAYISPGYLPSIRHTVALYFAIHDIIAALTSPPSSVTLPSSCYHVNSSYFHILCESNEEPTQRTTITPSFLELVDIATEWSHLIDPSETHSWKTLQNESLSSHSNIITSINSDDLLILSGDYINPEYLPYHDYILKSIKSNLESHGYFIQPYHQHSSYQRNITREQKKLLSKVTNFIQLYEVIGEDLEVVIRSSDGYDLQIVKIYQQEELMNLKESLDLVVMAVNPHNLMNSEILQHQIQLKYSHLVDTLFSHNNNNNQSTALLEDVTYLVIYWNILSPFHHRTVTEFIGQSLFSSILGHVCWKKLTSLPHNFFHKLFLKSLFTSNIHTFVQLILNQLQINVTLNDCQSLFPTTTSLTSVSAPYLASPISKSLPPFRLLELMNVMVECSFSDLYLTGMISLGEINLTEYFMNSHSSNRQQISNNTQSYFRNNLLKYETGLEFINLIEKKTKIDSSESPLKTKRSRTVEMSRDDEKKSALKEMKEEKGKQRNPSPQSSLNSNKDKKVNKAIKQKNDFQYEEEEEYYDDYDDYYYDEDYEDYYEEDYEEEYYEDEDEYYDEEDYADEYDDEDYDEDDYYYDEEDYYEEDELEYYEDEDYYDEDCDEYDYYEDEMEYYEEEYYEEDYEEYYDEDDEDYYYEEEVDYYEDDEIEYYDDEEYYEDEEDYYEDEYYEDEAEKDYYDDEEEDEIDSYEEYYDDDEDYYEEDELAYHDEENNEDYEDDEDYYYEEEDEYLVDEDGYYNEDEEGEYYEEEEDYEEGEEDYIEEDEEYYEEEEEED